MGKSVRDAMTPSVRTASPSQSLADAAQRMKSDDVGSVPIIEEGRLAEAADQEVVAQSLRAPKHAPSPQRLPELSRGK